MPDLVTWLLCGRLGTSTLSLTQPPQGSQSGARLLPLGLRKWLIKGRLVVLGRKQPCAQTLGEEPRPVWASRRGRKWGRKAGLPSPSRGWWDCCRWHRWRCTLGLPQSTSGSCLREPARGWRSGRKEVNAVEGAARGAVRPRCLAGFVLSNRQKITKSVQFNGSLWSKPLCCCYHLAFEHTYPQEPLNILSHALDFGDNFQDTHSLGFTTFLFLCIDFFKC